MFWKKKNKKEDEQQKKTIQRENVNENGAKKIDKEDVFVLNCPNCNEKSNFIKSSLPRGRSFDLRCSHCGAFCLMAPLSDEDKK